MIKKIITWALVIAMTAAIAVGGTMAYLTDTDEDVNVMTLGNVKIDQLEYERVDTETKDEDAVVQEFHDNKPLYPAVTEDGFNWEEESNVDWTQIGKDGYTSNIWDPDKINNELDKMVFVKNKGTYDAYVRSVFAFEANGYSLDEFKALFHLNINEEDWTWDWEEEPVSIPGENGATTNYIIATATYNKVLKPGELTEISLSQIALDPSAGNADVLGFGDTYQVLVKTQAIQTEGFDDPKTALDEGFGDVSTVPGEIEIPFESDTPIKGIDVRTALHNENGDTTKPITGTVTNVVFGLNSEYPQIVDNYDGTLVDVEQDVPVYSYYVKDGNQYTVYFLANSTIYCPKDSNGLFRNMKKLADVDMHNLDVSRVETMRNMFRECGALVSLDASEWDTSKVTDMAYMFNKCESLTKVDTGSFDTAKVTNFRSMFQKCKKLQTVDVSNWDTGSVTDMGYMFNGCEKLTQLPVDNWDTSSVKTFTTMFQNCKKLKSLDVSNWETGAATEMGYMFNSCESLTGLDVDNFDTSNVTTFRSMFNSCKNLKRLNVAKWDTSSATMTNYMFNCCHSLEEIEGIGNWDTSSVETMEQMFMECLVLKELDVGSWDVSNVRDMSLMFDGCRTLTTLDIGGWNTGKVEEFNSMFSDCDDNTSLMQLTDLDLSNWDVSSAKTLAWMFFGCGQLKKIDMSKWDVSNVTTMYHMFADCRKLETVNMTSWNTESLTNVDGMFNDCRSMKVVDVSDWDTQNLEDCSQLFEACWSLESIIGLENWDTSKAWDFGEMFTNTKLTELDLSAFDMSNATRADRMFYNNSLLKTIYVGDGWNMDKVTNSGSMFAGCTSLTGGNGTTINGKATDKTFACIDAVDNPGFLTYKAN